MSMSIKTLEEFYRDHTYAIPFEIMLLSKSNDTQESFKIRREKKREEGRAIIEKALSDERTDN